MSEATPVFRSNKGNDRGAELRKLMGLNVYELHRSRTNAHGDPYIEVIGRWEGFTEFEAMTECVEQGYAQYRELTAVRVSE